MGIDFLRHPLRRFIGLSEETFEECSAFEDMKKGLPTCRQSPDGRQKAILPRRGRIALSANERIAKFLHFAIQAKFAHVNRLRAADVSAVPALHGLLAAALIRAAHTLVALSGMTVAVGADVDCAQVTAVLRVVMTAGRNGTVNGLVFHEKSLQIKILSGFARSVVWRERRKICFCEKKEESFPLCISTAEYARKCGMALRGKGFPCQALRKTI